MQIMALIAIRGIIILVSEIPEAFKATSSLFSLIWPRVIIEARSVARGSERGRAWEQTPQNMNSMMTPNDRPRPTNSSM